MSIGRMIDDSQDVDRHLWQAEPPEAYQTVLDFFSAENEEEVARHCYKYTSCGAWIEFSEWGVTLGSIVEGCDFGTMTYLLYYKDDFTSADIQNRINAVEKEADAIWDWCNVLRDKNGRKHRNGESDADRGLDCPDIYYAYRHFLQGERSA